VRAIVVGVGEWSYRIQNFRLGAQASRLPERRKPRKVSRSRAGRRDACAPSINAQDLDLVTMKSCTYARSNSRISEASFPLILIFDSPAIITPSPWSALSPLTLIEPRATCIQA
jgi:hypothetical protein